MKEPCPKCGSTVEVHAIDGMACMRAQLAAEREKVAEANRALQEEQQHHRALQARLRDIISRMQQSLS